jgi:hypothetical protein
MAQDYVDDSNPFEREDNGTFEYGSGGRDIDTKDPAKGLYEGTSPAQDGVGKAGQGAPRNE